MRRPLAIGDELVLDLRRRNGALRPRTRHTKGMMVGTVVGFERGQPVVLLMPCAPDGSQATTVLPEGAVP